MIPLGPFISKDEVLLKIQPFACQSKSGSRAKPACADGGSRQTIATTNFQFKNGIKENVRDTLSRNVGDASIPLDQGGRTHKFIDKINVTIH
jgi:hypothetical protein